MIKANNKYWNNLLSHLFNCNYENVWDGASLKYIMTGFLILFFIISAPHPGYPQEHFSEISSHTERDKLDRDELEIAEDFKDIISQLERIANDYQEYFSKIYNNKYAMKYQKVLIKLLLNVNQGKYCGKVDNLLNDLTSFERELAIREQQLKYDSEQKKFYRNVRSLRSQLNLLTEYIEENLTERIKDKEESLKDIEHYLKARRIADEDYHDYLAKIYDMRTELLVQLELKNDEIEMLLLDNDEEQIYKIEDLEEILLALEEIDYAEFQEAFKTIENLEDLEKLKALQNLMIVPPVSPKVEVPIIPEPPPPLDKKNIPKKPSYPSKNIQPKIYNSGEVGFSKSYSKSISVSSSSTPIYIENQIGDLKITGWDNNKIEVSFDVEVIAHNRMAAEEFVNDVGLKVQSYKKGIFLNSHFPKLKDPKRKINMSLMVVMVPADNPLICENSFGTINIKNITKGIEVNAKHCQLYINDAVGGIKAVNSSGETVISNSSGIINITNSYGSVVIFDSDGDFDIQNAFANIELSDSNGPVRIQSSGDININNHSGQFDIDNQKGIIKVYYLDGDINVKNSFRPLYLSKISGNVNAENMNSSIVVDNIHGTFQAVNKYGMISGEDLYGPIHVNNEGGEVSLILDEYNYGPSSINSEFGVINLTLDNNSDIILTANVEGGAITSSFQNKVVKTTEGFTTKLSLGGGGNSFKITGNNTIINLDELRQINFY